MTSAREAIAQACGLFVLASQAAGPGASLAHVG